MTAAIRAGAASAVMTATKAETMKSCATRAPTIHRFRPFTRSLRLHHRAIIPHGQIFVPLRR